MGNDYKSLQSATGFRHRNGQWVDGKRKLRQVINTLFISYFRKSKVRGLGNDKWKKCKKSLGFSLRETVLIRQRAYGKVSNSDPILLYLESSL